ncbi:MAG: amidase [Gemmatimonadaceae bacterium]
MTARAGDGIDRRTFVERSLAGGAALFLAGGTAVEADAQWAGATQQDEFFELSIATLSERMRRGAITSRALTERYLARIESIDRAGPRVNSIIELNPDALTIADRRDAERTAGRVRGALHGIPVLIKDNIDTADRMRTSAGSLALAGSTPPRDAFIVERMREAGAVILGKTNLSEWANFRSTRSTSGWSARGGQTRNPYVLDRNPCGSSSGTATAIAADLATIGIGTETDGSIICPASICGLVGVKPTVGLWSRSGIIPISTSQDTAGPMARTVADAAVLLGALAASDPRDATTAARARRSRTDYTTGLDAGALRGARIGVARNLAGFNPHVDKLFDEATAALKNAGATIVDPANISGAEKLGEPEFDVLLYEFKHGLNAYLASLGPSAPVKTLAQVIEFNEREREREMPWFAQEIFERAQQKTPTRTAYRKARAACLRLARTEGIDATLAKHRLDAIVLPSNQPAWFTDVLNGDHFTGGNSTFAAVAGYPSVTVPMGLVHELPVGVSFIGPAWSESRLLALAYAFEQHTQARQPPRYLVTLSL